MTRRMDCESDSAAGRFELLLVCATIFFAPMNALRLPDYYLTLADVLALLALVTMAVTRGIPLRPLAGLTPLYVTGLVALTGGLLLSSAINGNTGRGLIGVMQYLYAYMLFPLVLVREARNEAIAVAFALLASSMVICLHGIIFVLFELDSSGRFVSGSGRLRGLMERENELAAFLGMSVPLIMWLVAEDRLPKLLGWGAVLTILYTIILTGSNTGIYIFMIAMAMMLFVNRSGLDVSILIAIIAIFAVLIGAYGQDLMPEPFRTRVLDSLTSGEIGQAGTLADRLDLVAEGLAKASQNLLIGMGVDQYRTISVHEAPVHNVYVLVLNEGGAIALLGLVLMLLAISAPGIVLVRSRGGGSTGAYLLSTVFLFALTITAIPHIYGRFWFLACLVALGIALTETGRRSQ